MALADVLSAMRHLILDAPPLSGEAEERQNYLQQMFPALTGLEASDLATIAQDKLAVYTTTVFRGEAGVLRRHFPLSFALLGRAWPQCYGVELSAYDFARKLHAAFPWMGYRTNSLTEAFSQFIKNGLPAVTAVVPELPEVAELERLSLLIARASDDDHRGSLALDSLSTLTVEELLAVRFTLSKSVCFLKTSYDVLSLHEAFFLEESLPSEQTALQDTLLVGSRDAEFDVRWTSVLPETFRFLSSLSPDASSTLEDLTLACTPESDFEDDEEKLFHRFVELLAELVFRGVIVLRSDA